METLAHCPVCSDTASSHYLTVQDWLVTKTDFELVRCKACGMVYTNPRPTEAEIGPYYASSAYISHADGKAGLMERAYQAVRSVTLRGKLNLMNTLAPEKGHLLDVGCATGHFLDVCKADGWQTLGTEPDEGARHAAQAKSLEVLPELADARGRGPFTFISLWHVLEHIHRLPEAMDTLAHALAPGGHILIAVPNHMSADARHYGAAWAAYDAPRHLYHFNPDTLRRLAERFGFKVVGRQGMPQDAFYVALLSERNLRRGRGGNPAKAAWVGVRSNMAARQTGQFSSITYILQKI